MALHITMPIKRKSFKLSTYCLNSEIRGSQPKYKPESID